MLKQNNRAGRETLNTHLHKCFYFIFYLDLLEHVEMGVVFRNLIFTDIHCPHFLLKIQVKYVESVPVNNNPYSGTCDNCIQESMIIMIII